MLGDRLTAGRQTLNLKMHVRVVLSQIEMMGDRLAGRTADFESANAGSNPALPRLNDE